jgi:putative transposase
MERKVAFVRGEYYHVYNRGVDKRKIFDSEADYRRFVLLLYLANSTKSVRIADILKTQTYEEILTLEKGNQLVAIGAYCLMPNHFHILATPLVEGGISKFMLKLQTGYSMYFNTKNNRNGSLFQGPFKSQHADSNPYLKYLFSYIHLNPAKLKSPDWKERLKTQNKLLMDFVGKYRYSSLPAYLTKEHVVTNPGAFPEYLSSKEDIEIHLTDWLLSQG